jgi:lysophospholipase L1-like esterase
MLGTNDCWFDYTGEEYKSNVRKIIDTLKNSGVKYVILSDQPTRGDDAIVNNRLAAYRRANRELIREGAGFVLRGDTESFEVFADDPDLLDTDKLHPNNKGHDRLGKLWAEAIRAALEGKGL